MIIQKFSILFLLLVVSLFKPADINRNSNNNIDLSVSRFNTDSLRILISKSGWNRNSLSLYEHFLINYEIETIEERSRLKNLPYSLENTYLQSIILKRELKYKEMFDSLFTVLENAPDFFSYYDNLVYAAQAANQLSLLENKINLIETLPEIYSIYMLSLISSSQGKYKEALRHLNTVLEKDSADKNILYNLSYIYRNLGDYEKALSALNSAKEKNKKNILFLIEADLAEGSLYFLSGDYINAEKLYQIGYSLAVKNYDRRNEAKALVNLGIIYDINGKVENARNNFNEAVSIAEQINDIETKAFALSELGVSNTFTNNLIEAKQNYLQSYALYKINGNKLRLALLSNNIGKIYMSMFDYRSAVKYYNEGLQFAGENKRGQVLNLMGLADAYSNLSNYTKALQYYKDAQKISLEINEIALNAEINIGLGNLNFNLDRLGNSLHFYSSAEEFSKKIGNPFLTADIYHKLGLAYSGLDSIDLAENYFKKAEKISRKNLDYITEAMASNGLADLYLKQNELEKASESLERSRIASEKTGWKYLTALSEILNGEIKKRNGNFSAALKSYQKSLAISKELNEFNLQIESCYLLAKLNEENNFNEAAESYYRSAVDMLEDVSRPLFEEEEVQISYLSSRRNIYNSLAEFYLNQQKYKKAFELIDRSRSRNMMQNLNNLKLQALLNDEKMLDKIYEYDWMIHSNIYTIAETDSIKQQYAVLKNSIIKNKPALEKYLNLEKNLSTDELKKNLSEGENLISIYPAKNKTYIFILNKNSFDTYIADISGNEIVKSISSISPYYEKENGKEKSFYNQDLFSFNAKFSFELYQKLLKNVLNKIPQNEKIIFVPPTEMLSFPFEFLVTEYDANESPYNYSGKSYLIYKYNISYIPSASAYVEQKNNGLKNQDKILIIGNPSINNKVEGFAERRGLLDESPGIPRNIALLPLKYSTEEVNEIGTIINADKILLGQEATETNFKENAELSKIIHLSTHSFLFNKQPLIFFSNFYDRENDGFLEAGEIVQLKLNSDLVVLSSCNSGLGSVDEAEGILGMTKAFFEAGSKSIVVSLWDVNDKYTSKFMMLFYKRLSEGYDKSEALRYAKIDFIKEHSANPYYWGAFVLSGNISSINLRETVDTKPYFYGVIFIIALSGFIIIYRNINKNREINNLS